jgi:hypothetical protein
MATAGTLTARLRSREVPEFLEGAYRSTMRLSRNGTPLRDGSRLLAHTRTDVGAFAIEQINLPGHGDTASPAHYSQTEDLHQYVC